MKLGFTGTRDQLSYAQKDWLTTIFDQLQIDVLHHGACQGADAYAHALAVERGIPVVVHPPVKVRYLANECLLPAPGVTVLPGKPYLNRDRDIVGCCEGLVALPKNQEPHMNTDSIGGTWYTIRYATQRYNRPVMICYPDGSVEKRESKSLQ
jgi:hypothetical protein